MTKEERVRHKIYELIESCYEIRNSIIQREDDSDWIKHRKEKGDLLNYEIVINFRSANSSVSPPHSISIPAGGENLRTRSLKREIFEILEGWIGADLWHIVRITRDIAREAAGIVSAEVTNAEIITGREKGSNDS